MNRIESKFRELKKNNKKAFIAFITAGFPNLKVTEELIKGFDRIGVDIVEIGVPFTDPMADGPVIQEASKFALSRGLHLSDILDMTRRVRPKVKIPICLMTYSNPVFSFPEDKFIVRAKDSGVDGLIIPDLPVDEASVFERKMRKAKLDLISFIAPTTSRERAEKISSRARGFIYYVSLTGVTGARAKLPGDLKKQLKALKKITAKPVCVGFGVSPADQVKEIYAVADGVIVGSAIVRKIKENISSPSLIRRVCGFVSSLKR
jgi:tryptophan synthase alpha chain